MTRLFLALLLCCSAYSASFFTPIPPARAEERCAAGVPLNGDIPPATTFGSSRASGAGITVAVIDTGVAPHPQLRDLIAGSDLVSPESPNPLSDCDAHGTIVAGIIASTDRGIAPRSRILSIRQTSSTSAHVDDVSRAQGSLASLAQAISEAVDRGARVINVSVVACLPPERARHVNTRVLDAALHHAEQRGVVVVAAAGNRSPQCQDSSVVYPAHSPTVVSVGALDDPHDLAAYSLAGGANILSAPGRVAAGLDPRGPGWITAVGTPDTSGFVASPQELIGTSFAAPVISGIIALLLEQHPEYAPAQVRAHLFSVAQPPHGAIATDDVLSARIPPAPPARTLPVLSCPSAPDPRAQSHTRIFVLSLGLAVLCAGLAGGFAARYLPSRFRSSPERSREQNHGTGELPTTKAGVGHPS